MNIRLGVIGGEQSVQIIMSVLKDFREFTPFKIICDELTYLEKLEAHQHDADIWMCTSPIYSLITNKWGELKKPLYFIPYTESSLCTTVFQAMYRHQISADQTSVDYFSPKTAKNVLANEMGIKEIPQFISPFTGVPQIHQLVNEHLTMWLKGRSKLSITCFDFVHDSLKKAGVPVLKISPSRESILTVINSIISATELFNALNAQAAVQVLECEKPDEIDMDTVLKYAQHMQGTMTPVDTDDGDGTIQFLIFTTRGMLKEWTRDFHVLPDMKHIPIQSFTSGIGIGNTIAEAQEYAFKALSNAKEFGKGKWMVCFSDKTITGPLGEAEQMVLTYASYESDELYDISQQTSLSVLTLSKLSHILKKIGRSEINAYELAQHMQIMPRSARRILHQLEKNGFAEVVGMETPTLRGRPRKMYRIYYVAANK